MEFCIRDDDTSFFTTPDGLERAYGEVTRLGPVSLAVVPFHRAGPSKGVPAAYRHQWSLHRLDENQPLVEYLRHGVADGRYEIMLHGCYHDEPDGRPEFVDRNDLGQRVSEGRKYLEGLLNCQVRVFVPPHNTIGREGLAAIAREGLHLGGAAGIRSGWRLWSARTWQLWFRLRSWRRKGGVGVPWVLDLDDHREIPGNPVTPFSSLAENEAILRAAIRVGGVFCAATHYWELPVPSEHPGDPTVGEQLNRLINLAMSHNVRWRTVGDVVSAEPLTGVDGRCVA